MTRPARAIRDKRITIHKLDWHAAALLGCIASKDAWADNYKDRTNLSFATEDLNHALCWAWLEWHRTHETAPIRKLLGGICERSANFVRGQRRDPLFRGLHDMHMLACGALAGSGPAMNLAAESASIANTRSDKPDYYGALAGVIRFHLAGDMKAEQAQLSLFERSTPDKLYISPSRKMARSLVQRDYDELKKAIAEAVAVHWSDKSLNQKWLRFSPKIVASETADAATLNLEGKNPHFYWPYPAALFASLALRDGVDLQLDDFWLPRGLLGECNELKKAQSSEIKISSRRGSESKAVAKKPRAKKSRSTGKAHRGD